MSRTQFLGVGTFAKSSNVTGQTRKNMYLESYTEDDKVRIAAFPTPGLDLFVEFGADPVRAMYEVGDKLYVIYRNTFYEVSNDGTKTSRGTLLTESGRCSIIDNGTQIMVVDGQYGYIYTISTSSLARITDADFSATPRTVTFSGGYFIITEDSSGKIWISSLYDGTAWNALEFATAESNPDNLVRVEEYIGHLILFGEDTTEFWVNTGELDFPYSRQYGTNMEYGLASRWSVTKFDSSLMFLAKSRQGEVKVVKLTGTQAVPVSDRNLENIFNSEASTAGATAFSYMIDGHSMYQITFPTLARTFVYDGITEVWHELTSSSSRHRGEMGEQFIGSHVVSDYDNGKIYKFNKETYTDNGAAIIRELTGRHHETDLDYFTVQQFILDCETGMGLATGQGSDPQVMMQYSVDNGHTWSEELLRSLGKQGEYSDRVEWWRLGRGKDFMFRVRCSDPVKFVVTGAGLKVARRRRVAGY